MKKETWVTAILLILCVFFALTSSYLSKQVDTKNFVSPFSSSFSVFSYLLPHEKPNYSVYGFLPYWSLEKIKFFQLDKLTDIAYFGLNINSDGSFRTKDEEGNVDPGYDNWKNNDNLDKLITTAKRFNVRVSLTVISHTDEVSDKFLSCESCWNTFANNLIKELDSKKIKDVNLNFEYVEFVDDTYADKYTKFVEFLNKRLDKRYGDSYVVVSTFADSMVKPRVTKIADLAKVSDAVFIMAYDFHQPNSDNAGPVAPIGGAGDKWEYDILTTIKDYLANAPADKLILGVPYYGYNWVVTENKPSAERIPGSDETGFSESQTYEGIMDTILELNPIINWDDPAQTPYFTYVSPSTDSTREVYFDNEKSLQVKYELIKSNKLKGVGIWALGYDGGYQDLWKLLKQEFIDD